MECSFILVQLGIESISAFLLEVTMFSYLCSVLMQSVIQQNTHLNEQEGKYEAVFLTCDFVGLK
jgi:hypothetical protein